MTTLIALQLIITLEANPDLTSSNLFKLLKEKLDGNGSFIQIKRCRMRCKIDYARDQRAFSRREFKNLLKDERKVHKS